MVAPCDAIDRWVHAIAPHTTPDHTVLLAGEGGGAIVARRAIEPPTIIADTNTLPLRARATGPATIEVTPKRGGVLVASLPATPPATARVMELIGDVWPHVTATDTVWTTVLTSYDALDAATLDAATLDAATLDAATLDAATLDAATADALDAATLDAATADALDAATAATLDAATAATLDAATADALDADAAALDAATADALDAATADALDADAADAAIAAADAELRALRQALFSRESRGYHDFRMAQGLTPDSPPPNQAPDSATPGIPCGDDNPPEKLPPDSLVGFSPWGADNSPENPRPRSQARQPPTTSPGHAHASTPPAALVLASSLGRAAGVPTPAIDALVSGALAPQGPDLTEPAPTLAALGLGGLDVTGLVGFARSGYFP